MKKIKMSRGVTLTFEEGCNKYLEKFMSLFYIREIISKISK